MGLLQAAQKTRDYNSGCTYLPYLGHRAEGAGFEPAVPYSDTPLFESGTINHSDTLPPRSIPSHHSGLQAPAIGFLSAEAFAPLASRWPCLSAESRWWRNG